MKEKIILISNDVMFYRSIQENLQKTQIDFCSTFSLGEVMACFTEQEYCLIILDTHQIGSNGLDILQVIQPIRHAPVLVLMKKLSPKEKVALFYAGADVCLEKDVGMPVIIAQINALLKLYSEIREGYKHGTFLSFGSELVIIPRYRQVLVDGNPLALTRKEFDLLHFLASNPRQVLTREQLYQNVWRDNLEFGGEGTVKAHISTLRKKLTAVGKKCIENVWGIGYKFIPPCSESTE